MTPFFYEVESSDEMPPSTGWKSLKNDGASSSLVIEYLKVYIIYASVSVLKNIYIWVFGHIHLLCTA